MARAGRAISSATASSRELVRSARRARDVIAQGGSVALVGPAGIGKTTLAARVVGDRPAVRAQCLLALQGMPYRPLSHALGATLMGTPDSVATEVANRLDGRQLVIEDLHWADEATVCVALLLAERGRVLITSRSPLPANDRELCTVEVEPLGPEAADALVAAVHPELSPTDRLRLADAAGGNPLMLIHLAGGGSISPTFEAALAHRVSDLPRHALAGMARLALHGRPIRPGCLDVPDPDEAEGILVETDGGAVWFVHERFASAILDLVGDDDARRLRADVAAASNPADAVRHHLVLGNLDEAARCALIAAEHADPATRSHLLATAVDALGDMATDELRLQAADAMISAHRTADARRFALAVGGDDETMAEAGLQLARAAWLEGDQAEAMRLIEAALARVGGSGSPVEAWVVVERASLAARTRVGDPAILAIADDALAIAERVGVERARALSAAGLARSHTGQPGWDDYFLTAAEAARVDEDVEQECAAVYWHISALGFYGPMSRAVELGTEMVQRTAQVGPLRWHHHLLGALAIHLTASGAMSDDVLAACQRLLAEAPLFRNRSQVELSIVAALADRGSLERAATVAEDAMRHARNDEERAIVCCARCEVGLAARDPRIMAEALSDLADAGAGFFGLNAIAESAALHLALAMPGRYELPQAATRLTPVLDVVEVERHAHQLQLAGRTADAIDAMGRAADEWATRRMARFARRARCGAIEIALAAGDLDVAARLLDGATCALEPGIADVTARRVAALDRSITRAQVSRWLTDREIEVLVLVAAGLTTKQIAQRLGIGAATVDTHIAEAMRRLDCRTRRQAAAIVVS